MSLALDLRKFAEKAGKNADIAIRTVCLDLTTGVVFKTPVDTGRARGNWQASIGTPAVGEVATLDKSGTAAIAAAQGAIARAPGNVFVLANNLPYIARLEFEGYSNQAPAGMARITILEITNRLR